MLLILGSDTDVILPKDCHRHTTGVVHHSITQDAYHIMSASSMAREINVSFGNITADKVPQLRKMNASIFPVRYNDSFYTDVPDANPDFTQFGEWAFFYEE